MCGINGIFNKSSSELIPASTYNILTSNLKLMNHRGPNAQNICQGENWAFAHARLAVIDLISGSQPMTDKQTGAVIVYNGEVYNFREIRDELIALGHVFETDCDTEVVLKSYLEWREKSLEKFQGFFSFSIYNPIDESMFFARDRLGIKPFYYSENSHLVAFGSTIPSVLTFGLHALEPDLNAISHYLTTARITLGEKTLVKNIKTLEPGTWKRYDLTKNSVTQQHYWSIPIIHENDKPKPHFAESAEKIKSMCEQSVKSRLIADVPIGCFLSGGLDSSIISLLSTQILHKPLPFFSAGTNNKKTDEFEYADLMNIQLKGTVHREIITPDSFWEDWNMLIKQKGMPLSTPNETSIYRLAKSLKKQCTVALTGEGADEIFGGYIMPHFGAFDFARSARTEESVDLTSPFIMALMRRYGRGYFHNDADHFFTTCSWIPFTRKMSLLTPDAWNQIDDDDEVFSYYENLFDSLEGCSSFDKRMHLHAKINLEGLLNRVDSSTMAASVEARVPFTDHKLVEFAFSQPDSFKIDWFSAESAKKGKDLLIEDIDQLQLVESKRLLRNAFQKQLPKKIVSRKKMSFPVPYEEWFAGPISEKINEICRNSSLVNNVLSESAVNSMLMNKDRNLWLLANLCLWWKNITEL